MSGGWFGTQAQLLHVLRTLHADADADGNFYVRGTIANFLGLSGPNADVVVGSDAQYRAGGQWRGLAAALNGTSYGLRDVTVI